MKKNLEILIYIAAAAGLILIAVACGPLFSTPETPTSVVTQPPVATFEPVDYEPAAGSSVAWVDMSYVVYVPPGEFQMGENETEPSDHSPAHTVYLDGFWIHQTEVTNRMYALCVDLGICTVPYHETGKPYWYANPAHADAPVVGVDWYNAEAYCEWIEGRLPTEAEWEKAARGTNGDPYPWGDEDPTCDLLNFDDCLEPSNPIDVRSYFYGASPFELADTAGNASEWVFDWYDEEYYAVSPIENPTGPVDGDLRVVRGSNFTSEAEAVPVYLRSAVDPLEHHAEVGFRCVLGGETVGNPPPQACEMPPAVDTGQPLEPDIPSVIGTAYCIMDDAGLPHGYVNLVFDEPVEVDTYEITSSAGMVMISQDSSHPDTLILSGPGIPIDQVFELTVCPALVAPPLPPEEPICPAGYILDTITGKCRYLDLDPGEPCGEGFAWLEGYGCIWAATDPLDQLWLQLICALVPGYQIVELSDSPLTLACLPVDGPEDCGDDPNCSLNTECLPGLTYVPDLDCCAVPPTIDPVCLAGYKYDPINLLCYPKYPGSQCISLYLLIPSCEAPPLSACTNPSQYTDETSCEAANCRWVPLAVAPSYCTYP
ncbi:MAG: formylglycine-generating enzyme family protein [Chloroflexi bacterium]|nr:formylglycine-generating enzyme family protein [Chloroflexota bacterium]